MKIGRITKLITDNTRYETLCNEQEKRRFMISIFYPADHQWQQEKQPTYLDLFSPRKEEALQYFVHMGAKEEWLRDYTINIYENAPIEVDARYPVVLYSPGMAVDRDMYVFQIEKLVSAGAIVITVGSTYETLFTVFADTSIVYQSDYVSNLAGTDFDSLKLLRDVRIGDLSCLLDRLPEWNETGPFFKGTFNLDKMGAVGHSLGGAAVHELVQRDERVKAGVLLDGSLHLLSLETPLNKPLLSIRQEHSTYEQMKEVWSEEVAWAYSVGQQRLYEMSEDASFVKVKNADHMSFSDVPILYRQASSLDEELMGIHQGINEGTRLFFDPLLFGSLGQVGSLERSHPSLVKLNQRGEAIL